MVNAIIISNSTAYRATVIADRTCNDAMGVMKAMLIDTLKVKLANGVAHFLYLKKNGEIREAIGTTNKVVAAKYTNGNGCSRECFCTTAYFDIERGEWRSFRWENLVKVF